MASVFLLDPSNVLLNSVSVVPQTIASITTVNGTGVDMANSEDGAHALITTGTTSDATLTFTVKLQESLDNAVADPYTDVSGVVSATFTNVTGAKLASWLSTHSKTKRWVRAVVTSAGGGSLSLPIEVSIHATKKILGNGNGSYTGF